MRWLGGCWRVCEPARSKRQAPALARGRGTTEDLCIPSMGGETDCDASTWADQTNSSRNTLLCSGQGGRACH